MQTQELARAVTLLSQRKTFQGLCVLQCKGVITTPKDTVIVSQYEEAFEEIYLYIKLMSGSIPVPDREWFLADALKMHKHVLDSQTGAKPQQI